MDLRPITKINHIYSQTYNSQISERDYQERTRSKFTLLQNHTIKQGEVQFVHCYRCTKTCQQEMNSSYNTKVKATGNASATKPLEIPVKPNKNIQNKGTRFQFYESKYWLFFPAQHIRLVVYSETHMNLKNELIQSYWPRAWLYSYWCPQATGLQNSARSSPLKTTKKPPTHHSSTMKPPTMPQSTVFKLNSQ